MGWSSCSPRCPCTGRTSCPASRRRRPRSRSSTRPLPRRASSARTGRRRSRSCATSRSGHVGELGDGPLEWLLWQTLVGAWPLDEERLTPYLVKAAREAKLRTSWTRPDARFEESVAAYVRRVLADDAVRSGVAATVERLH